MNFSVLLKLLDTILQKTENMLKSYLWAFQNWKQNKKTPYGSIFIAVFG